MRKKEKTTSIHQANANISTHTNTHSVAKRESRHSADKPIDFDLYSLLFLIFNASSSPIATSILFTCVVDGVWTGDKRSCVGFGQFILILFNNYNLKKKYISWKWQSPRMFFQTQQNQNDSFTWFRCVHFQIHKSFHKYNVVSHLFILHQMNSQPFLFVRRQQGKILCKLIWQIFISFASDEQRCRNKT